MQAEQAGFCAGLGAPELVPVLWGDHHLQGFPQTAIQVLGLGDHELPDAQLIGSPGLHQLAMAEHPDPGLLGGLGPFEAGQGQVWIGRREPGQFNLLQPLPRRFTYHQGQGLLPQGQGHQQADPPIGLRAWSQAYHGVIPAPQAAGDEPAQAEMVGPVPASLTLE